MSVVAVRALRRSAGRRAILTPRSALLLVVAVSLVARAAWLSEPCHRPCTRPVDHLLIFDETYYVNAARVIAGIHPPSGANYPHAPLGDDPNSEHPQGVKLIEAASISILGDGPLAWRWGSLAAGTLAVLGMWSLAGSAGAAPWVAVGAAALMSADTLLLVLGRIGTLDIYAVAAMVWAAAWYLRGRPIRAGAAVALGIACKEVAVLGLGVLLVLEVSGLGRGAPDRPQQSRAASRLALAAAVAAGGFCALLEVMDRIAPPYDPGRHRLVGGGVLGHIRHIVAYGASLSSPHGPRGIASYPWQWLVDLKPIVYLSIDPGHPAPGLSHDLPRSLFLGMISPPILLAGLVGAGAAIVPPLVAALGLRFGRSREAGGADGTGGAAGADDPTGRLRRVGVAWCVATWVPFELFSLLWQRTSYLYYMAIVMPGLYLLAADAAARLRESHPRWFAVWAAAVGVAAVVMYPFTPLL